MQLFAFGTTWQCADYSSVGFSKEVQLSKNFRPHNLKFFAKSQTLISIYQIYICFYISYPFC
ncbi:hypothetical protein O3M35_002719 [Rhynocoris fuscipes]|uniref:Uncharacterized protein n=1 Tax=Rhynocoris fuscipes TaxID=488301 RepID=A0AAW1CTZ1_9HEMI